MSQWEVTVRYLNRRDVYDATVVKVTVPDDDHDQERKAAEAEAIRQVVKKTGAAPGTCRIEWSQAKDDEPSWTATGNWKQW